MTNLKQFFQWKFSVVIIFVLAYLLLNVDGTEFSIKKRVKRKVVFTKSSKFFFRLNGKENILNYTTLLAHGWGFRINYDLPHTLAQRMHFFKRDIHNDIEEIQNPMLANMVNCVLSKACAILSQPFVAKNCGIFCGIGKIVASSQGIEADFFKTFSGKCQLYHERCPGSFEKSSIFGFG
ncbi:uncharacterized protein LOC109546148 [Dendroctonus ponderosae]|uniref:Uncharacterized protein n=1 Tax=Dendroctonus ponderosae TaxID=77166 RepID=A0AAR5QH29_DENPD|nr:uncharacterized protein LOC109546148 [Dendroctonus ponderosae]